jgi:hypothetical protein
MTRPGKGVMGEGRGVHTLPPFLSALLAVPSLLSWTACPRPVDVHTPYKGERASTDRFVRVFLRRPTLGHRPVSCQLPLAGQFPLTHPFSARKSWNKMLQIISNVSGFWLPRITSLASRFFEATDYATGYQAGGLPAWLTWSPPSQARTLTGKQQASPFCFIGETPLAN